MFIDISFQGSDNKSSIELAKDTFDYAFINCIK